MSHSKTVLQGGSKKLLTAIGATGATGATGVAGSDAVRNVRLVKVTITITDTSPYNTIAFESILETGDIWDPIVSGQFSTHATIMKGEHSGFLNAANSTNKVKAFLGNESTSFQGIDLQYTESYHLHPKIIKVGIDKIEFGILRGLDLNLQNWSFYGLYSWYLPIVVVFNLYLIGEDS